MRNGKLAVDVKSVNFTPHEYSDRFEKLYAMLLDTIPSSVLLVDQNLRIVSANRNFLEKSRLSLEDTIGQRLERVFPDVIREKIDLNKRIRRVFEQNEPVNGERMTYRAPGVPIRIYYYSILPFSWQGIVDGAILLMDDVTEQVRLSEEVRRVERHLASIVESASDIVLSTDVQGKILSWNSAAERLSGYTADEAIGRCFFDFCANADKKEVRDIFTAIDIHEPSQMKECLLMTKDNNFIPVYWVFSPFRGDLNQTLGVVAVGRDLAERRKLEMKLLQSQKLTSLGIMAGGIAHEIRNPLAICSSTAQFLRDDNVTPAFRKECAEKICSSIQRISTIIENLLRFAHPSPNTHTNVNLVTLIKETMTLVNYHARIQKIETSMDFAGDVIMVQGVATLLQQVFMNLFLNAINAMPDGGLLLVSAEVRDHEAHIRVCDTGCGISQAHIDKIFDPFYTTSAIGKGAGLGLSICYSIVKQHSGTIEVESIEGKGSTFTVRLPIK